MRLGTQVVNRHTRRYRVELRSSRKPHLIDEDSCTVKISALVSSAAVSLVAAAVFTSATVAQAPQSTPDAQQQQPGMRRERKFPPPTNLQVLPKDLTGNQVVDIMQHWAGDLGVECSACHAANPNRVGRNGRPMLDFASDEKPQKRMARIMYTMTETIKKDYIPKVQALDTMGSPVAPVTCGTCHRGHLDPEEFVPPRREEHGPRPQGAPAPSGN